MFYKEKQLYDRLISRLDEKKDAYDRFNIARDSITEYFRLDLGIDSAESDRGKFFGRSVYEGTAPWAAATMAKFFQGSLVSPNTPWIKYVMRESELKGVDELDIFLKDVLEHMTSVYRRSNYYQILPNYTRDGLTIGSPVIYIEENDPVEGTIKVMPQHYKHCSLYYDKYGDLEGLIVRDPTWTAKQIADRFGDLVEDDVKYSESLRTDLKAGHFNNEHTMIWGIFKATDPMFDREGFKKPAGKKWIGVYFEENGPTEKKDEPLETSGFFSRPFMTWNYHRLSYEVVSRTPAYEAIYDCLSQQQVHKDYLENSALQNRPPMMALQGMENRLELWPEGIMFGTDNEYQKPPKSLDIVGEVLFNKDLSAQLGEAVKRHFMLDVLMRYSEIAKTNKQPLSVYQLWKISGENATLLSPAVETYSGDLLGPVDERFVDIEMRAGRGPFERNRMEEIRGIILENLTNPKSSAGIVPEFIGPLHKSQKVQQAIEPIMSGLQAIGPVFEQYPNARFILKPYELADEILQAVDFPAEILNTKEDFDAIVADVMAKDEEQKQLENSIEIAKASKDVSGPVDESSVLSTVAGEV